MAEKKYERKCDNWLASFNDWIRPRSEAPNSYIFWSGLFILSSALRRRVWIPAKYMGNYEVFPHMYIMLVGPPGMRKTTTARKGGTLLEQLPKITPGPPIASSAALIDLLVKTDDAAIYLIVEEFGDLLLKTGFEIYEFLTSLYDNKIKLDVRTVSHQSQMADKPCINLLAATTPQWIGTNMPEGIIGGGFASRVIFLYEDEIEQDRLEIFYDHLDTDFSKLDIALRDDLAHISTALNGPFKIDDEAKEFIRTWYKTIHRNKSINPKLAGYMMRKPQHVLKTAMVYRISYSDDLTITLKDAKAALGIVETIEPNLIKVFEGVGKNRFTFDQTSILAFIKEKKKVERHEVFKQFKTSAEPMKLMELIQFLVATKEIVLVQEDDKWFFKINE